MITEECPTCGKDIEMDNCDQDLNNAGRVVFYLGTTHGFKCRWCDKFCHTDCGDNEREYCKPCAIELAAA